MLVVSWHTLFDELELVRSEGFSPLQLSVIALIPSCVLSCHSERSEESGQMLRVTPFHCVLLSMTDSTLDCNLV